MTFINAEGILIVAAIIGFFFIMYYIRKRLSPRVNVMISGVALIALIVLFLTRGFIQNFTAIQQIVLAISAIGYFGYLVYKYRKNQSVS